MRVQTAFLPAPVLPSTQALRRGGVADGLQVCDYLPTCAGETVGVSGYARARLGLYVVVKALSRSCVMANGRTVPHYPSLSLSVTPHAPQSDMGEAFMHYRGMGGAAERVMRVTAAYG